jgi:hypothetical protein
MDTVVTIARQLWSYRAIVLVLALVSVLIGGLVAYQPGWPPQRRAYHVGSATAHVLVDTPVSQVIEVSPKGSETLGSRASLLANLLVQGEVKASVAQRAGLRVAGLIAVNEGALDPTSVSLKQMQARDIHLLKTSVMTNDAGSLLPILTINAQAPDVPGAAKLANAAVAALQAYLDDRAVIDGVADSKRLRVRQLGAAQAGDVFHGPSRVLAVIAALFLFGAMCATLLFVLALKNGWQAAKRDEQAVPDGYEDDEDRDDDGDGNAAVAVAARNGEPVAERVQAAAAGQMSGWVALTPYRERA